MSVKIKAVAKQLPPYSRLTADILPYVELWLAGKDERFIRKALKIFGNAGVDKRYSIMEPDEV
ncbi:MAG: type III polyketide synthase, partial [Chitinophagaceae bacterium]